MQNIYTSLDAMDAHFLKGLLAEQDIEATIQGETMQEVWGSVPVTEGSKASVWVAEADVSRATPIVEEYERRRKARVDEVELPARPTWTCPRCGEKVEVQFTSCWHCNTKRPTAV